MASQRFLFKGVLLGDIHIDFRLIVDTGISVRHKNNRNRFDCRSIRPDRIQGKRNQAIGDQLGGNTVVAVLVLQVVCEYYIGG